MPSLPVPALRPPQPPSALRKPPRLSAASAFTYSPRVAAPFPEGFRVPRLVPRIPALKAAPLIRAGARYAPPALRPPVPLDEASQQPAEVRPNPYVDFVRRFTAEGGIEITYKDIDDSLWRKVVRITLWLAATGLTAWFALEASPLDSFLLNAGGALAMAWVYWKIVGKPDEVHRRVEIRPDCMIIEGEQVFFTDNMELGWPSFAPDAEGNHLLQGVYGTRAMEYLTVRRFDENDRAPEVFAAHLRAAMQQQWSDPARRLS